MSYAGLGKHDHVRHVNNSVDHGQGGHEAILFDTGDGIFKPDGYGGGIFDGNLDGLGADAPLVVTADVSNTGAYITFFLAGAGALWIISSMLYKKNKRRRR
jgi:hypothetical protein